MNAARHAVGFAGLVLLMATGALCAQDAAKDKGKKAKAGPDSVFPPKIPGDKEIVTDKAEEFLKPAANLRKEVTVAKTPPTIDFAYYPGQTYPGRPWSNWGDSLAANGKYYASIGDHLAPAGNAFVYEYDPLKQTFRQLADIRKVLNLPDGHYTPGKIHGRLDMGDDGWIYFSTHRGSPSVTNDKYHYKGDWIFRCDPASAKAEIVTQGVVPKHCVPNTVLDPKRMIFYGGTAAGSGGETDGIQFFAYDIKNQKVLYSGPDGPARYMIFVRSTGRVYYTPGHAHSPLMRYDPAKGGPPVKVDGEIGIRSATQETPQGFVYTVSQAGKGEQSLLYAFNTKTEKVEVLGEIGVGAATYVSSIDADPATGRYLYYVLGAHGGSDADGAPIVQYDVKTKQKKVLAFLHPYYKDKYGATLRGTYSTAIDAKGETLYVTWNISRGSRAWDCCGLTAIHIPESERQP